MNHEFPLALSFDDVLLVPQYSELNSRSDIDLTTKLSDKLTLKIPLITTNVDTITGVDMAIAIGRLGGLGVLPRFDTPQNQADRVRRVKEAGVTACASIGVKNEDVDRAEILVRAGVDVLDLDVAHGHMKQALEKISELKNKYGDSVTLMTGIVATAEAAEDHYKAGSEVVASGLGSGSICITRVQTGSGVPGFSSLIDIAPVARRYNKTFIPLAGIRNSGDIVKSLAAGASAVRGGFIFAGTDEAPGDIVEIDGKKFKSYNGSTSKREKAKHVDKYKTDKNKTYSLHIEGVESLVQHRGSLAGVVDNLLAGIRSGLSYSGASNIPELWEKSKFVRITASGVIENSAHDVLTDT